MARSDYSNFTIHDFVRQNISDMSRSELQSFIKAATPVVEESFKTRNEQINKSKKILRNKIGTVSKGGEVRLKTGLSKMNTKQLRERASLLQSHLNIDRFSRRYEYEMRELSDEVKDKIRDALKMDLSDEEVEMFRFVMEDVRKLNESFESKVVAEIINEVSEMEADIADIITAIHEVWDKNKNEGLGLDIESMQDMIIERIKNKILGND